MTQSKVHFPIPDLHLLIWSLTNLGLISKTISYKLQELTRGLVTPTPTPAEAALWLRAVREVSPSPPIQRGLQSDKDPRPLQLQGGFCCIFSFEGLACKVHSSRRKRITPPPAVSKSWVLSTIHTVFRIQAKKQEQKNILEQNWLQWILTFCNSMFSLLCAP